MLTSHELAKKLLEMPNQPVVTYTFDGSGYSYELVSRVQAVAELGRFELERLHTDLQLLEAIVIDYT